MTEEQISRAKRARAKLTRQFDAIRRHFPAAGSFVLWLQSGRSRLYRVPIAILLIFGGLASVLPFLGFWMLPLGIMLLALDLPFLQGPVAAMVIRARRRLSVWLRWRRAKG